MINTQLVKGIIFDMDGVLVDSEKYSCYALNVVFDKVFGIDIGTDYSSVVGKPLEKSLQYYLDKFGLQYDNIDKLKHMKENAYIELATSNLQTFPGCFEFLDLLKETHIVSCIASSGIRSKIKFSLKQVNMQDYFKVIVSAEDATKGKPAPDIFLEAAKRLYLRPDQCLVIEDSINGVKGAITAGMQVVAFPGSFSLEQFDELDVYYAENGYVDLINLFKT